ncbi:MULTISPECIES: glycoside hydrolase family 3 N-terminal domain-containing protein [Paenibacillus]|uniref:glycoside hydrolase family 3 N-terminal domain-containing protein n=1 Tax=Paenibacillus TaxID=44249 RepID=UPI00096FEECA|nr:glycoside hydrolase family 3 N-terminal domain-containing protein [Paenibacillus odorifer]OMD83597.1 hypothetical protein BSK53_12460 [Paenibacillus odorifer]
MSSKKRMKKKPYLILWSSVYIVILCVVVALNSVAIYWDKALGEFMGTVGEGVTSSGTSEVDTEYYKSEYSSTDELHKAQQTLAEQIVGEGTVLLKNDDVLPLQSGSKISLFGLSSSIGAASGSGSGEVSEALDNSWSKSIGDAGFEINETLLNFYANSGHKRGIGTAASDGTAKGEWKVDEVPQAEFTQEVKNSYSAYKDAAVVIFSRGGGEGGDLPTEMSRHEGSSDESYLELDSNERDLLKAIKDAGFEKTVVIINSSGAMELGFADQEEFGVDACLWVAGTGATGINAMGKVLSGEINPSGRLVDTYVYDNFSSPAMQNFGDYRYADASGKLTDYSYVNYGEGIYVGYKYYETRYEDVVMGTENVGDYNYDSTVKYPFGYGLSYTDFKWSDYSVTPNGEDVTVKVTVTNTGKVAGKDVVGIYYQSPYTDYDKENGIEKASVNLVEFAKTGLIEAGQSETIEISFGKEEMESYDAKGAKTYILEDGEYHITAAPDAHAGVNNILAAKQYTTDNGMTQAGDAAMVGTYTVNEFTKLDKSASGGTITNKFDESVISDFTYLTRSNWKMMDNGALTYATGTMQGVSNVTDAAGTVGTITADENTLAALKETGRAASGVPEGNSYPESSTYTYGTDNGLELVDLRGKDYNDPMWDDLLNQMKLSEMHSLFGKGGYGTSEILSINKPKTFEYDGPSGIANFISGESSFSFPAEIVLAATWNVELAEQMGKLIGEDGISTKTSGWYAPAINTHRTPFSGRNFEYFSEDGILSGKIAVAEVGGVQSKGVYVYLKHFALNDQETNRAANGHVATWSNEQAIREIYLKPFQYAVERADAHGVMTALNRIGTKMTSGHYNLLTDVLRGEWGFKGVAITDYLSGQTGGSVDMMLSAGMDLVLATAANTLSDAKQDWSRYELREAAHNVLYNTVNSLAMNGFEHGSDYKAGTPVYKIILYAFDLLVAVGILFGIISVVKKVRMTDEQYANRKRMSKKAKRILWIVLGIAIVTIAIVFFIVVLPLLQKAFLM